MKLNPLAALILSATFSASALAKVATVNGEVIPQAELDSASKQVVASSGGRIKDTPELRQELKQQLINRTVILQEAKKRGLDKSKMYKDRLDAFQKELLHQMLLEDIAKKNPVSDAQVKAEYDKLKSQLSGQKEVRAREIILGSEAEAKDIITQLKKGAKFEELARKKSKDPAAKQTGGEMGWVNLGAVPPPLAEAFKPLNKNQVSDAPLQSNFGFHVFKVEETRTAKVPPYDEIKDRLKAQMQGAQIEKTLFELRDKAKIQ